MSLDDILKINAGQSGTGYATTTGHGAEILVITCMDPRLVGRLEKAGGFTRGDTIFIKNAGNLATDEVMRSLAIALSAFQLREILVIGHTDCAMTRMTVSGFLDGLKSHGVGREAISSPNLHEWLGFFPNEAENVRRVVESIRNCALIPSGVQVHGLLFRLEDGVLEVVDRDPGKRAAATTAPSQTDLGPAPGPSTLPTLNLDTPESLITADLDLQTLEMTDGAKDEPATAPFTYDEVWKDVGTSVTEQTQDSKADWERKSKSGQFSKSKSAAKPAPRPTRAESASPAAGQVAELYDLFLDNLGMNGPQVLKAVQKMTGTDFTAQDLAALPFLRQIKPDQARKIKEILESWGARVVMKQVGKRMRGG